MTRAIAVSRRVAISVSLSQSSISFAVKSIAIGLTLYWLAYFGADPCVGSNTRSEERRVGSEARVRLLRSHNAFRSQILRALRSQRDDPAYQRGPPASASSRGACGRSRRRTSYMRF